MWSCQRAIVCVETANSYEICGNSDWKFNIFHEDLQKETKKFIFGITVTVVFFQFEVQINYI